MVTSTTNNVLTKSIEDAAKEADAPKGTKKTGTLGKDEFLQLLVTQLKYQDPMKPMEDKEFIGQMAQFSALEQMQNLNSSFTTSKALSMVGKNITANVTKDDKTEEVEGVVQSVKVAGSKAYVMVDGEEISVDDVVSISEAPDITEQTAQISQYSNLIGRTATGLINSTAKDKYLNITGKVKSVSVINNIPIANLGQVETTVDSLLLGTEQTDLTTKAYLEGKVGNTVNVTIKDENGNKSQITAKVVSVSGDDAKPSVVFEDFNIGIQDIYRIKEG